MPKGPACRQAGFTSIIILLGIAFIVLVGGVVVYQKLLAPKSQPTPTPTFTTTPSSISQPSPTPNPTANWKTYNGGGSVTFKLPLTWMEKSSVTGLDGSFVQKFEGSESKFVLTFSSVGNYNQVMGKPYATIDELINMPYKVKTVVVDGREGRQPLPRAGSENINSVILFSRDSKTIYTLELQTVNTPETDIEEGQKLFDQILSTFKFLN